MQEIWRKVWLWFNDPDRPDPVVPRLWHGPATKLSKELEEHGIDPSKYGIDPARVAKFQRFKNAVKR